MVRQTLIRTIALGIGTVAMGFYREREIGINSKYSMSREEFKARI